MVEWKRRQALRPTVRDELHVFELHSGTSMLGAYEALNGHRAVIRQLAVANCLRPVLAMRERAINGVIVKFPEL